MKHGAPYLLSMPTASTFPYHMRGKIGCLAFLPGVERPHEIREVSNVHVRALGALSLIAAVGIFFDAALSSAAAQDDLSSLSCGDIWYRRNEIFARNGYCFKTDRAIRVFGNQGCRFYVEADVPMSRAEREEVEILRAIERGKGCEA